jgi:hypothetical protein
MFTDSNPLAPALSPLGRGEGVVSFWCVGLDSPRVRLGRHPWLAILSVAFYILSL